MKKSLKSNFIVSLLRIIIVSVTPLIIFPYAARILGTQGIGKVQYIQSIAGFFQVFASFGITTYGIREGAKLRENKEKLGEFTSELLIINMITTLLTLFVYVGLFFIDDLKEYKSLLLIFILYIFFYGMNLDWFFNAVEEYIYITKRTAVFYFLSVVLMLLCLKSEKDTDIYALVLILPYIGMFCANIYQMTKQLPLFRCRKYNYRQHIKSIVWFFAITLSINIYVLLDTVMLGFLSNDVSVGLYSAASKLSRTIVQLIAAASTVFIPRLSYYIGKKEIKKYQELLGKTVQMVLILIVPASLGLLCLSKEAIAIYSGREFVEALPAMQLFSIFLIFSALNNFLGTQILVPNGKEKMFFKATIAGALADIILNFYLIPKWDFVGATLATFISEIIVFCICIYGAKEFLSIKTELIVLGKCFVASLPIIGITNYVKKSFESDFVVAIVSIVICSVIYYIMISVFKIDAIQKINYVITNKICKKLRSRE